MENPLGFGVFFYLRALSLNVRTNSAIARRDAYISHLKSRVLLTAGEPHFVQHSKVNFNPGGNDV